MAVREFVDESGREWRAWDIKPENIHPVTKAEDYLADCFITGWIVFETRDGEEKRRLCPWPMNWATRTDSELRELLGRADLIPTHRLVSDRIAREQAPPALAVDVAAHPEDIDVSDLQVVRTFKYPGGRFWTVCVVAYPEDGGSPVLRFTSGLRFIDLKTWPKDWADHPDEELVWMLRRASPRRPNRPSPPGIVLRRWDDNAESHDPTPSIV